MAGQAEHVDVLLLDVDVQVADGLNGVGVEGHARFLTDGADLPDGQDGADLVVGVHGGNQAGVGADGVLHLLSGDVVTLPDVQIGDFKALFFQLCQGVQHGVVLKGRGDDVGLAPQFAPAGGGADGLVVGLAAPGGEVNLFRPAVETLSHGLPGLFQGLGGPLAQGVEGGGVAIVLRQIGEHGLEGHRAELGGGGVVGIYHGETSFGF